MNVEYVVFGEEEHRRHEATEMRCYRRILMIPWAGNITNDNAVQRIGSTQCLLKIMKKKRGSLLDAYFKEPHFMT